MQDVWPIVHAERAALAAAAGTGTASTTPHCTATHAMAANAARALDLRIWTETIERARAR